MKTILHKASDRGHANHGWLDTYHSFSFGQYHNPARVHFGALRVLNDDTVKGGYGFGKHPHDNMEIVTIPLKGDLKHEDSTGRKEVIRQYDVQIMSAGSGIAHSEMNANQDKDVELLQIWVFPKERNITPRYDQKTFRPEDRLNKLQTVVAPGDSEGVYIHQDAWFSLGNFEKGFATGYTLNKTGNGVYAFVIEGEVTVNGTQLGKRDALGISDIDTLDIKADTAAELLLIEVPMELNNV
ncbi:MAG: pirin family protein [Chitinophagaceae bacterium]|jgi:redox-sensitive bicupin YhaK (pirin superfamily)|nr:pirin family protein [Chitinophagaceae bacterium]